MGCSVKELLLIAAVLCALRMAGQAQAPTPVERARRVA